MSTENTSFRDTHVTEKVAAETIGSTPKTMQRWRFEKRGPRYLKVGGKVFYAIADLKRYLAERVIETRDPDVISKKPRGLTPQELEEL